MRWAPALEALSLGRRFGERWALREVSFTLEKGEMFALLGPNGGGKTTLFRIISTLLPPTEGQARIFGHSVAEESPAVRRRIGVVFQSPSLDSQLPVLENLIHHGHLYGLHGQGLRRSAAAMLDRLGVADRSRDLVKNLSGGLARRVELAKGMLHRPSILLLDEPSAGLDPSARLELMKLLEELRRDEGVTVVLTTHFLEEAERADRVAILDRGRLVAVGPPADLRSRIGGDIVTIHAAEAPALRAKIVDRFGLEATVVSGTLRLEAPQGHQLLRDLVEAFGSEIRSASFGRPTLEDVFVHLTGHVLDGGDAEPSAGGGGAH